LHGSSTVAQFLKSTFGLHAEDTEPFVARLGFRVREIADATVLRQRYFFGPWRWRRTRSG
jgi:hypothetical protein